MTGMEHFDFAEPAEVYVGRRGYGKGPQMSYLRFPSGAEAVRYAIEQQSADKLAATVLEVEEARFSPADIRELYDSPAYPLPRRQQS